MHVTWMDSRDGDMWDVRVTWSPQAFWGSPAKSASQLSPGCFITFTSDDLRETFTTENHFGRPASLLSDDELQELLDKARGSATG